MTSAPLPSTWSFRYSLPSSLCRGCGAIKAVAGSAAVGLVLTWQEHGLAPLQRGPATTLQLNIGLYCNQACSHCHVESSPLRTEAMDRRTAERCLHLLAGSAASVRTLDLTGGAPELNPQFRYGCTCLIHATRTPCGTPAINVGYLVSLLLSRQTPLPVQQALVSLSSTCRRPVASSL